CLFLHLSLRPCGALLSLRFLSPSYRVFPQIAIVFPRTPWYTDITIPHQRRTAHETDFLERQRPACLPAEGLSGLLPGQRRRHILPAGDKAPGRPGGGGPARLPHVLELRRQEGLLR